MDLFFIKTELRKNQLISAGQKQPGSASLPGKNPQPFDRDPALDLAHVEFDDVMLSQ